jgi:hypothetical protein
VGRERLGADDTVLVAEETKNFAVWARGARRE